MPQALVITLYRENYAFCEWNGEGECPQYWKNKDSLEYVVALPEGTTAAEQQAALTRLAHAVSYENNCTSEQVVATRILPDGEPTPREEEFAELLAAGLVTDAERACYAPKVFTLDALEAQITEHACTPLESKGAPHVDA